LGVGGVAGGADEPGGQAIEDLKPNLITGELE
jgi:hypothetical protein